MFKYIRPISDIHLDFDDRVSKRLYEPAHMSTDHETVLCVAGDIWHAKPFLEPAPGGFEPMAIKWFRSMSERFHSVVFVLGNHDYWGYDLQLLPPAIKHGLGCLPNVHFLEKDYVDIEGVRFVGATLWTDFDRENPHTLANWKNMMVPDAAYIQFIDAANKNRNLSDKLSARHLLDDHKKALAFIKENVNAESRMCVVITHMAPCSFSVDKIYRGDPGNGYYYSELGDYIVGSPIDLWIHGHMHLSKDYVVGYCRVLCNPRGYAPIALNPNFQDQLCIPVYGWKPE